MNNLLGKLFGKTKSIESDPIDFTIDFKILMILTSDPLIAGGMINAW